MCFHRNLHLCAFTEAHKMALFEWALSQKLRYLRESHFSHCFKKTLDTIGNCQRPVLSLVVSQICIKSQTCENLSSIGRWSCEIIMKEKTPLPPEVVCFIPLRWLISRPQILNLRSQNLIRGKLLFFSKTMSLHREPFLTMFYAINLSPLLVTK